ncbi:hypothetical protein BH10ACI2_BH10ACI2_12840 [soil metagenome]
MRIAIALALVMSGSILAQDVRVRVETLPEYNAVFNTQSGWTGGDGDYSIALSKDRILWFFSDSWIGNVRDDKHIDPWMINNAVGIQTGIKASEAKIEFSWGPNKKGKPTAFLVPDRGKGSFWIFGSALTRKGLFVFLQRVIKTDGKGLGFQHVGTTLANVENPLEPPGKWRISQAELPFGSFPEQGATIYGSSVLQENGFVYIYGTSLDLSGPVRQHSPIVSRVEEADLADFRKWRFFSNGKWVAREKEATALTSDGSSEYSVSFVPSIGRYVMVNSRAFSRSILLRTAPTPVGEWTKPQVIYDCPEPEIDKRVNCYAAKAHPELSSTADELIVSYVTNSTDFFHLASDARIYRPRFLKVKFDTSP